MASIQMFQGTTAGKSAAALYQKSPRITYKLIDLAKVATAKGSALVATDVIQCINVPANTAIKSAGVRIVEVADFQGDNKFKLGTASSDAAFVASGAGSFNSTFAGAAATFIYSATQTTINLTLQSWTASVPTTGVAAVWAELVDLNEFPGSNINATDQAGIPQA